MCLVRTCDKCEWDFPSGYTRPRCKFCGEILPTQICIVCKEHKPRDQFYIYKSGQNKGRLKRECKACLIKRKSVKETAKRHNDRKIQRRHDKANEKFAKLQKLFNKDAKPMSEADWLAACDFFGGCAICGADSIETRQFLLNPKDNKHRLSYVAGNMIPMCGACSTQTRFVENPFVWMDNFLGAAKKLGLNDYRRERIMEYLNKKVGELDGE